VNRDLTTLVLPHVRELVEIRLEVPREESTSPRTASWVVRVDAGGHLDSRSGALTLRGTIKSARWGLLDDGRVERQRDSIDRLLNHLKVHCPELLGTGQCRHIGGPEDIGLVEAGG
jgi:hypothetical protein